MGAAARRATSIQALMENGRMRIAVNGVRLCRLTTHCSRPEPRRRTDNWSRREAARAADRRRWAVRKPEVIYDEVRGVRPAAPE